MTSSWTLLLILTINALLAVGDVLAKKAVLGETRSIGLTISALAIWVVACGLWLPTMRARGFTRLIAMADVIGIVMLATVGYLFLDERLSLREIFGLLLALGAIILLHGGNE